jgi:4-amino-4-deoxy-L-arabinose transferase-like glycosyltransferase
MQLRFYIIVALSIVVYGSNLGGFSIYILDEAKNASCAMEMMQRGDLVVPTFNVNFVPISRRCIIIL